MKQSIFQRWLELREQVAEEPVIEEQATELLEESAGPFHHDIRITSNQRFFKWHNDGKSYKTVKP